MSALSGSSVVSKKPWGKVFQVATPGLPFVIGAGRLIVNVLNIRFLQRIVEPLEACAHSSRFVGADPHPKQMDFFGEGSGIGEDTVVIGFRIEFTIAEHQHSARAAEAADIRKEIEMIERDLKCLHAAHGEASHCAMIAVRERAEG